MACTFLKWYFSWLMSGRLRKPIQANIHFGHQKAPHVLDRGLGCIFNIYSINDNIWSTTEPLLNCHVVIFYFSAVFYLLLVTFLFWSNTFLSFAVQCGDVKMWISSTRGHFCIGYKSTLQTQRLEKKINLTVSLLKMFPVVLLHLVKLFYWITEWVPRWNKVTLTRESSFK